MTNPATFSIRARGPRALFCPPWLRAEPFSEPVITPAAAAGVFRSIYRKPQFEFFTRQIRVLSPIRYASFKVSGIKADACTDGYGKFNKNGKVRETEAMPQHQTVLVDVDYILTAEVRMNESANLDRPGKQKRSYKECVEIINYYFLSGSMGGTPCAGRREFPLDVQYLGMNYPIVESHSTEIPVSMPLGPVLIGMSPVNFAENKWDPVFARLEMNNGVIDIDYRLYDGIHKKLDEQAGVLVRSKGGSR